MHWCQQETDMVLMSIPVLAWLWLRIKLWLNEIRWVVVLYIRKFGSEFLHGTQEENKSKNTDKS